MITRLLLALAIAFLPTLASAEIFEIDSSVTGGGTFNSNTQKIARNKNGTLVAYLKDTNAAYDAQRINFVLISPNGTQTTIASEVHISNPPCIEASASGEFFAVLSDWGNAAIRVLIWRDIANNPVPERYSYSTSGSGKFSCNYDESRRILYYLGYDGKLIRFGDGLQFAAQQIFTQAANVAQYPNLKTSQDGSLHVFWNTLTGTAISYRGVQYIMSPNDAVSWYRNWHPAISSSATNIWLQSPVNYMPVTSDETGLSWTLSRSEDLLRNSYLLDAYADNEQFGAIWQSVPNYTERCFVSVKRCTTVLVMYDRRTLARTMQAVPLMLGREPVSAQGGGALVKRKGAIYFVWNDRKDLIVGRLEGGALVEVSREAIPGVSDAKCPYSLTAERGLPTDGDIVGVFTLLNTTCHNWATSTEPASTFTGGKILGFRVQLP